MKNLLLFAAVSLLSVSLLQAQSPYIGIKTGIQKHTVDVSGSFVDFNTVIDEVTHATFGLVAGLDLSDKFSLQTEINYTRRGFETEAGTSISILGADVPAAVSAATKLDYIEVPLLAKYRFGNGPLKFYAEGGGYAGYAASANIEVKGRFLFDVVIMDEEINLNDESFNRFDYGLSYGAGVEYELETGRFVFGVRGQQSMNNMLDDTTLDLNLRNSSLGATVSYVHLF